MTDPRLLGRRRWWVLVALLPALLIPNLDGTMLLIALPSIGLDLDASVSDLQWVTATFTLGSAALLPLSASMGDLYGRKRAMLAGYILFILGTSVAGFTASIGLLFVGRGLQGFGMALLFPNALAKIGVLFDSKERGRAVGLWIAMSSLALVAGPLLGGWLVETFGWNAVFRVNVLTGVFGAIGLIRYVPDDGVRRMLRLDIPGIVASTIALFSLTLALVEAGRRGIGSPVVIVGFTFAAMSAIGFFFIERRSDHPLLDPGLFTNPGYARVLRIGLVVNTLVTGTFFMLTLYLQSLIGMSASTAGLVLVFAMAPMVFTPYVGGALTDRMGLGWPLVAGLVTMGLGLAWLSLVADADASLRSLFFPMVVFGLGLGSHFSVESTAIVSNVPQNYASSGAASLSTVRQVGGSLAVALFGTLATFITQLRAGDSLRALGVDASTVQFAALDADLTERVSTIVRSASVDAFVDVIRLAAILTGVALVVALPLVRSALASNRALPKPDQTEADQPGSTSAP